MNAVTRVLAAVVAAVVVMPAGSALAAPPVSTVQRAEDDLRAAQAHEDSLTAKLDAAAELYERANAAAVRLGVETANGEGELALAHEAVASAKADLRIRVLDAYKHPFGGTPGALTGALTTSPDAATALHRAALLRRIAASAAGSVEHAQKVQALTVHEVTAARVVAAGSAAAAEELERTAAQLRADLEAARNQVVRAEQSVADARADARRAAEAARLAARYDSVTPTYPAAPAPVVDGRACPVGTPNSFIDSWGFPRSGGRTHEGVDIFAASGTPLYAVGDGWVETDSNTLGGLVVRLYEDTGDRYYYAHLSSISVTTGQRVKAGDVIGAVGNTGNAITTPPHLHWQVHPGGGAPVNPTPLTTALCR